MIIHLIYQNKEWRLPTTCISPEAILCDEPTGALDKKTGKQIMDLLHQVVLKNGIMLLIVTHDLDIAKTCNTIFEMDGGRLQCVKYDS